MRHTLIVFLAAVFAVGIASAQEEQTGDELEKIKGPFAETWVREDADISQYTKLYPWKAVFQFRDVEDTRQPRTSIEKSRGGSGPYTVSEEGQKKFEEVVADAFVKELGRSKQFEIVDEIGPDTLLVRATVMDIVSSVPGTIAGTVDSFIASLGEATLIFELIDAETGVVQATTGERQQILPPSRATGGVGGAPMNEATIWNDVKNWATVVARELRTALDKAQKKAGK
jgi:hypothetical protein